MSEEINCPLCQTSTSEPVIDENGYTGRQCDRCGLIFISPRPSREEMDHIYESGEAHLPPEFFVVNARSFAGRVGAWQTLGIIRRHVRAGSMLEIGPGSGGFLVEARNRGFDPYGVELNPIQAEFIRSQWGIQCAASLEAAAKLGPAQFDLVYHRDVISHFYDPIDEFKRINALLAPGGYHVFQTGNLADVDHRYFAQVKSFQYPDHLFFYGDRSIGQLLAQTGLKHVHTYRYSMRPEQALRMLVWRLRGSLGSNGGASTDLAATSAGTSSATTARLARSALDLTYHAIRHTVGRIAIKGDELQTLIVVARKLP